MYRWVHIRHAWVWHFIQKINFRPHIREVHLWASMDHGTAALLWVTKFHISPFSNGQPTAKPQDFLTGFIADQTSAKVYGRPVGVAVLADGSLLVADDDGNIIWRVAVK